MKQVFNMTDQAGLHGVQAVVDYGDGFCLGMSFIDSGRLMARSSRLPGFWRLKERKA